MKKKIIFISVALIGFVLALAGTSWAEGERGGRHYHNDRGHFQKWEKPRVHKFHGDRHYRPAHRFKPKFNGRHHYRPPYRFGHKYRYWRHGPRHRHFFPKRWFRRHHRGPVVNNYYSSTESYAAPEESFQASASVSDTGFSVSVGVSKTN